MDGTAWAAPVIEIITFPIFSLPSSVAIMLKVTPIIIAIISDIIKR
jgi:hypothetical protein